MRRTGKTADGLPQSRLVLLALGTLAATAFVAILFVAALSQREGVPGRSFYRLTVELDSTQSLGVRGAEVRMAGRLVGQTEGSRIERGLARVDLRLEPGVGPMPRDTRAVLRPRGLLGTQYIDLVPGRSERMLADGGVIPVSQTKTFVQLTDVIDTFNARTRASLQATLRGLGSGLAGRGTDVNAAVGAAPEAAENLVAGLRPLLREQNAAARLIGGAASFTAALEPVRRELAQGFPEGSRAVQPFARERASVARLLEIAPGALEETRSNLAETDDLLASATRFADATTRFTTVAPAGLRATTRILRAGRAPLHRLRPTLDLVPRATPAVLGITREADAVIPRVGATLRPAQRIVDAIVPYHCDIWGLGARWRSLLGGVLAGGKARYGPPAVLRVQLAGAGVGNLNLGTATYPPAKPCGPENG